MEPEAEWAGPVGSEASPCSGPLTVGAGVSWGDRICPGRICTDGARYCTNRVGTYLTYAYGGRQGPPLAALCVCSVARYLTPCVRHQQPASTRSRGRVSHSHPGRHRPGIYEHPRAPETALTTTNPSTMDALSIHVKLVVRDSIHTRYSTSNSEVGCTYKKGRNPCSDASFF